MGILGAFEKHWEGMVIRYVSGFLVGFGWLVYVKKRNLKFGKNSDAYSRMGMVPTSLLLIEYQQDSAYNAYIVIMVCFTFVVSETLWLFFVTA